MVTFEIAIVLAITLVAFYLFIKEIIPTDVVAILIMVTLAITGILEPNEIISGFSNPATITVLCMFMLSAGIERTGTIHSLGEKIQKIAKNVEWRQALFILIVMGPISAFINNTAAVAIMLPMVVGLAQKTKTFASRLLIPLSYVSMAGGTLTLIGTSTNILAAELYAQHGFEPIGIFAITKLGSIVLGITILYFLIVGRFLLPKYPNPEPKEDPYKKIEYQTDVVVLPESPLINQKVLDNDLTKLFNIDFVQLTRNNNILKTNLKKLTLQAGDVLLVNSDRENLLKIKDKELIDIKTHKESPQKKKTPYKLSQFIVSSDSSLLGKTIASSSLKERFSTIVLGIRKGSKIIKDNLEKVKLEFGDILLVRSTSKALSRLKKSKDVILLDDVPEPFAREKSWHAWGILLLVVALAALKLFTIMIAALIGVLIMTLIKVIPIRQAYDSVRWDVIMLLAGMIPLGIAFEKTGTAQLLADQIIRFSDFLSPVVILGAFYLITTLLTEIISNNAAVILLIPIALNVAAELSLNPFAFLLAIMFAASTSFLTPVGYQTNAMVYSAGKYKFKDFFKVGLPLNILLLFVTTYLINSFWGI